MFTCAIKQKKNIKTIHLLMLNTNETTEETEEMNSDDDDDEEINIVNQIRTPENFHFMWIKNLSRLLSKQLTKRKSKSFICDKCLNHYFSEKSLAKHLIYCSTMNEDRVHDHCHLTGRYRGAAHQYCNLQYTNSRVIPVVFHNLSGYDAHFLIKKIAVGIPGTVTLLPINKEKYISFTKSIQDTKIQFRFINSYRFMPSSLDKLSSYLSDEEKIITRTFSNSDVEFKLLTRKGIFPYEYIDSWEKLNTNQLLP